MFPSGQILLNSMDERPIAASGKLLLITGSAVRNTGQRWNSAGTDVTNWGESPTLIQQVKGTITLRGIQGARSISIQPIDGAGHPLGQPVPAIQSGTEWKLPIGATPTTWYPDHCHALGEPCSSAFSASPRSPPPASPPRHKVAPSCCGPTGAPAMQPNSLPDAIRITPDGERVVTHIQQPSITPYLPAPTNSTGTAVLVIPGGGHSEIWAEHEGTNIAAFLPRSRHSRLCPALSPRARKRFHVHRRGNRARRHAARHPPHPRPQPRVAG